GGQDVHFVRRVLFGSESSKDFTFAGEGRTDVALANLPSNLTIEEVRFTASGTFPQERVLPPIGPDAAGLAELVADVNRAILARLRKQSGLAELTGVRLPLTAGADGAEAAVALWSNKSGSVDEPVDAIPQAVSTPVTLNAGAAAGEQWTTFAFPKPVAIDAAN